MKKITFKILLLVLLSVFGINAQSDTLKTFDKSQKDSDTVFVMQKSPWGAVLRSAIVPGWGQFYNGSYWKVPVVLGVSAWFIGNWISNNNLYIDYRDKYEEIRYSVSNDPNVSFYKQLYLKYRDFYRDQRDMFAIYMGIAYVLTLVDAYVDAHMFDFTVKEDFVTKSPYLNMSFRLGF